MLLIVASPHFVGRTIEPWLAQTVRLPIQIQATSEVVLQGVLGIQPGRIPLRLQIAQHSQGCTLVPGEAVGHCDEAHRVERIVEQPGDSRSTFL